MNKELLKIFSLNQTIFSVADLGQYIKHKDIGYLRNRISFYKKKGILKNVAKGLYSLNKEYDIFELANKIYAPSYISFFSALYYHKIIFQYQHDVYLAYRKSDIKQMPNYNIILKNLKEEILFCIDGIERKKHYSIASPERAFLDTLYIFGETYFDNMRNIDLEKAQKLVKIYKSKKLEKLLTTYL